MLRKALPPRRAAAATAFRRLPPFRESVVPWLAAAAGVALGAAVKASASSSGHGSFDYSFPSQAEPQLLAICPTVAYLLLLVSVQCSVQLQCSAVES